MPDNVRSTVYGEGERGETLGQDLASGCKDAIKSSYKTCTSAILLELAQFMEDMAAQKTCQLNGWLRLEFGALHISISDRGEQATELQKSV